MPLKGERHSKESNEKNRLAHLGKKFTDEHRRKIALGSKRTMGLRVGFSMKGKQHSDKTKQRMSDARKGYRITKETKNKLSIINTGKKCSIETRKKMSRHIGASRYNWKGGNSPYGKNIRGSLEYKLWRESVFIKDNYTCRVCGKSKMYLQAHHIFGFTKYPELRFSINNGVALCKRCHYKAHTGGG